MAFQPPPPDDDGKKSRKTGLFGSIMQEVGDIVREVKQDLDDMTPLEPSQKRHETNSELAQTVGAAQEGMAYVDTGADEDETEARRLPPAQGGFKGNPWDALILPGRMRIGCGYIAAEASDIWTYAERMRNEAREPYTLGMVVAEPSVWEGALPALAAEARMFGATGQGPRTLAPDLDALDESLTALLNDNPKMIAVGLLAIDEPYAPYALKEQQAQMRLQLEIAADFGMPAYVGHRRSLAALASTLKSAGALPRMIWAEPLVEAEELDLVLAHDMHVLARPELTHTTPAGLAYRNLMAKVAPQRQLLSSGSTLSAPAGREGERNNLLGLDASLKALAEVTGQERPEILALSNENAHALFYGK